MPAATSNYTVSLIDVPGAASTFANGVNNLDEIVGYYAQNPDTSGGGGFLEEHGTFTTLNVPGSVNFTQVQAPSMIGAKS